MRSKFICAVLFPILFRRFFFWGRFPGSLVTSCPSVGVTAPIKSFVIVFIYLLYWSILKMSIHYWFHIIWRTFTRFFVLVMHSWLFNWIILLNEEFDIKFILIIVFWRNYYWKISYHDDFTFLFYDAQLIYYTKMFILFYTTFTICFEFRAS